MAVVIDGKALSATLRAEIAYEAAKLVEYGITPGLAVVLVGDDPASQVYVRAKARQTVDAGMVSFEHRLPTDISEGDLLAFVDRLNRDERVDGILVQLPLPRHIDTDTVVRSVDPAKDVDGFHPINVGLVAMGGPGIVPCTPSGVMRLIRSVRDDLAGLHAMIVGRSNIVGKPMAQLLLREHCTVTVAHSHSKDLPALTRGADILIAAVGRPEFIRGDWVKPGAIVIDVGINHIAASDGPGRLVGDVAYHEVAGRAAAITPVPGGVGPMTIACLLQNTLAAARARRG